MDDLRAHLTEEEQGWLRWAERRRKAGRLVAALRHLAEARSREGELVAALQKYSTHGSGCLAEGWKRGDNEYRCDCGLDAALAAALGEKGD